MKLLSLAKQLEFKTEIEYFDYLIESYENGQIGQCKDLFNKMTKKDKKSFIEYLEGCYDYPTSKAVYRFYWSLI